MAQQERQATQFETWVKDLKRQFSKEDTNGQQKHKKMLNIISHQGNITHNHNDILPHTH